MKNAAEADGSELVEQLQVAATREEELKEKLQAAIKAKLQAEQASIEAQNAYKEANSEFKIEDIAEVHKAKDPLDMGEKLESWLNDPKTVPTASDKVVQMCKKDPATNRKVLQLLERAGAAFTTSTHAPCRTSEDAAAVRGATLASGAKAILVRAKTGAAASEFVLVVIAADQKLDSKACKKALGAKSISFASEAEVLEITGCVPGAVPPFGSAWGLRTLMDTSVQEQGATINFNAGLRTFSVLGLAVADYVRAEAPTVCRLRSVRASGAKTI